MSANDQTLAVTRAASVCRKISSAKFRLRIRAECGSVYELVDRRKQNRAFAGAGERALARDRLSQTFELPIFAAEVRNAVKVIIRASEPPPRPLIPPLSFSSILGALDG
jgi:hypothetical protein